MNDLVSCCKCTLVKGGECPPTHTPPVELSRPTRPVRPCSLLLYDTREFGQTKIACINLLLHGVIVAQLSDTTAYHYSVVFRERPGVRRQRPDDDPTAAVLDDCSTVGAFRFLSPTIRSSFAGSDVPLPSVFCRPT